MSVTLGSPEGLDCKAAVDAGMSKTADRECSHPYNPSILVFAQSPIRMVQQFLNSELYSCNDRSLYNIINEIYHSRTVAE